MLCRAELGLCSGYPNAGSRANVAAALINLRVIR